MLRIDQVSTIGRAEEYLRTLDTMPSDATRRLALSHNLRLRQCGGLAAIVQVIVTWARRHELGEQPATLIPFATKRNNESVLARLVETLPGLVAVLMAREILSQNYLNSLRNEAYGHARRLIELMDEGALEETAKGMAVSLLCADETSKRALRPLYHPTLNGGGVLRGEKDFILLAQKVLKSSLSRSRRGLLDRADTEAVGVLLRELFGNTHEHARKDIEGRPYKKSVRGFLAAQHGITPKTAEDISGGFAPLQQFMARSLPQGGGNRQYQFFEISMFDSGPGYASRMLRAPIDASMPVEKEFAAVEQCFLLNVSTRHAHGGGIGLARLLSRLKVTKGFLRIRTGRLSLFKDFSLPTDHDDGLRDEDFQLFDAHSRSRAPTLLAPVSGAVVTVLMPLQSVNK